MTAIFYLECVIALIALFEGAWNMAFGKALKSIIWIAVMFYMGILIAPELNAALSLMA